MRSTKLVVSEGVYVHGMRMLPRWRAGDQPAVESVTGVEYTFVSFEMRCVGCVAFCAVSYTGERRGYAK